IFLGRMPLPTFPVCRMTASPGQVLCFQAPAARGQSARDTIAQCGKYLSTAKTFTPPPRLAIVIDTIKFHHTYIVESSSGHVSAMTPLASATCCLAASHRVTVDRNGSTTDTVAEPFCLSAFI